MKKTSNLKKYRSLLVSVVGGFVLFFLFVVGGTILYGGFEQLMAKIGGNAAFIQPKILDLGSLEAGTETTAVFKMTNLTLKEISVVGERSSCDCIFSEKIPIAVPTGKTIDLKVNVHLPKYDSFYDQTLVFMVTEPNKLSIHSVRVTATILHPLPRPIEGAKSVMPLMAPLIEKSKD